MNIREEIIRQDGTVNYTVLGSISFSTTKGTALTGEAIKTDANTYLAVNGSLFFSRGKTMIETHHPENFCKSMSIKETPQFLIIHLNKEQGEKVYYTMFPNRRKVSFVRHYEDFNVHNGGETIVKGEVWLMPDGTEQKFPTFKRPL